MNEVKSLPTQYFLGGYITVQKPHALSLSYRLLRGARTPTLSDPDPDLMPLGPDLGPISDDAVGPEQ